MRVRDQQAGVFFSRGDGSAPVDGRREFFTGWRREFVYWVEAAFQLMARKRLFSCYGREGLVQLMGRREAGFMEG